MKLSYFVIAFFFVLSVVVVSQLSGGIFSSEGMSLGVSRLYVDEIPVLGTFNELPESDEVYVRSASMTGDRLVLSLAYSGCASHTFSLYVENEPFSTNPLQVRAFVIHNRHGDSCEKVTQKMVDFELSQVKDKYRDDFRLIVEDYEGTNMSVDVPFLD